MRIDLNDGKKSENDTLITITADNEAISFKQVALLLALLTQNEQILTLELSHYKKGSQLLKNYLIKILDTDWTLAYLVDAELIIDQLRQIYGQDNPKNHLEFNTQDATIRDLRNKKGVDFMGERPKYRNGSFSVWENKTKNGDTYLAIRVPLEEVLRHFETVLDKDGKPNGLKLNVFLNKEKAEQQTQESLT